MFLNISYEIWQILGVILSSIISTAAFLWTLYESRKNSREQNKMIEESTRANLRIYTAPLITNRDHFYIVIKNLGNSSARIEKASIDETTDSALTVNEKPFSTRMKDTVLAPGQTATYAVVPSNLDSNHVSTIELSYFSTNTNKVYKTEFKGKLRSLSTLPSIGISDAPIEKQILELLQDHLRRNL